MALLATTALEWTWGEREPLVFLGEWCRRYERRELWQAREHVVVRNHWDDRRKLHHDELYLKSLHDELLGDLARALGKLHGLERSRRFWQTLLDPWLARYLGVAFDHWENLRVAFAEHDCTHSLVPLERPRAPVRDHFQFLDVVMGDEWNYDFYLDALQFEYAPRCTLMPTPLGAAALSGPRTVTMPPRRGWRPASVRFFDRLCGRLSRGAEIAFIQTYFPLLALTRLNVSLGQFPVPRLGEFTWPDPTLPQLERADSELRARIALQREPANRFEQFLQQRIRVDLLQVLVESFASMHLRAAAIRWRPRLIFSATAHWFNDLFKHWLAECVRNGSVFVAMEHGGCIPPRFSAMNFEEDVADVKTTWALPYHPRHARLPANRFAGRRPARAPGTRLLVVGSESPRYAYDLSATPVGSQTLVCFEQVCQLHGALEEPARGAFMIKPFPVDLGWRQRERFVARLGAGKVASDPDLDRMLRTARIVVCTYPQTTFSQALTCGAPALLLYVREFYETVARFDPLLEELRAAQLVFSDPLAAAAHISRIWAEPHAWWDSPTVRAARRRIELELLDTRPDWLVPWLSFARNLAAGAPARVWLPGSDGK